MQLSQPDREKISRRDHREQYENRTSHYLVTNINHSTHLEKEKKIVWVMEMASVKSLWHYSVNTVCAFCPVPVKENIISSSQTENEDILYLSLKDLGQFSCSSTENF